MKRNDSGDFCVLYVEPDDDRAALVQELSGQKKPVVILLAEQARLFHSPEDFNDLKHVKRHLDVSILFVIPESEHLAQMAARHGFAAYPSMDALSDALIVGAAIRQRRPTVPLPSGDLAAPYRKTRPLSSRPLVEEEPYYSQTLPLVEPTPEQLPRPEPMRPQRPQPARRRSLIALALLMLIALLVAGLGSFMVFFRGTALQTPASAPAAPQIVGHVSFLSSEQVSDSSSQGLNDEVLIDLTHLPSPAAGKSYYAWLLGDHAQSDMLVTFLGVLPVNNKGNAMLFYRGDAAHTNLLLTFSRFLVTEEDAALTPVAPSPDETTWRYYGEFSQTPLVSAANPKGYSFLDHLRHLLAADPTLDEMELPGGLNTWFYNNTSKLLEWTTSMREPWEANKDIGFVRRQSTRVLDYLDGVAFVSQDLPPGTPVLVDARLGSIGLLQVAGPNQNPPSYISHIVEHLNGLLQVGKFSPSLQAQGTQIVSGLDNIQGWLEQVRGDARQIMHMTDAQLRQPAALSLINDMITNVSNAYAGEPDPVTGQMHEGVSWIHEHMQSLASMDISPYHASTSTAHMIVSVG